MEFIAKARMFGLVTYRTSFCPFKPLPEGLLLDEPPPHPANLEVSTNAARVRKPLAKKHRFARKTVPLRKGSAEGVYIKQFEGVKRGSTPA